MSDQLLKQCFFGQAVFSCIMCEIFLRKKVLKKRRFVELYLYEHNLIPHLCILVHLYGTLLASIFLSGAENLVSGISSNAQLG